MHVEKLNSIKTCSGIFDLFHFCGRGGKKPFYCSKWSGQETKDKGQNNSLLRRLNLLQKVSV